MPPFEDQPVGQIYQSRVADEADLVVVISDQNNRRGTGKTVLSLQLAAQMDRTAAGVTPSKATLSPEELINSYTDHAEGAALILDEAEKGIEKRSAMSKVNRALSQTISMGRVEQKYLILNAPSSAQIDRQVKELADLWFIVQRRGMARVYYFDYNPFEEKVRTHGLQRFTWPDIDDPDLRQVYRDLTTEKREDLRSGSETDFVPKSEHEAALEDARKETRKELRNQIIYQAYESHSDLSFADVANLLPDEIALSPERTRQIYHEVKP